MENVGYLIVTIALIVLS